MRVLLILLLFILILSIAVICGAPSSPDQDPVAKNLPKPVQTTKNDNAIIVAAPNGTVYFVENSTGKVLWSFSSGPSIYSSYQQLPLHEVEKLNVTVDGNNYYIDCGEDWKLHQNETGHEKKLILSAEECIKRTPFVSVGGGVVLGTKRTAVFLVDAKSGKVVRTVRSDEFPSVREQGADGTSIVTRNDVEECLPAASPVDMEAMEKPLYVTRTDYTLKCTSLKTGEVQWYLMFANVEASFQFEGIENVLDSVPFNNEFIPEHRLDEELPIHCQTRPAVIHIRGHGSLEPTFMTDRLPDALPGGRMVSLPAADNNPMLEARDNLLAFHSCDEKENMLALPTSGPEGFIMRSLPSGAAPQMSSHVESVSLARTHFWSSMSYSVLVPVAMAFFFYVRHAVVKGRGKLYEQSEDLKVPNVMPKKRKGRKSGVNKKNINAEKRHENNEHNGVVIVTNGFEDTKISSSCLPRKFSDNGDTYTYRRKIGKLIVTNKEIAKGSNGTIVLEGNYDGRPVAVKRLVRTHHDVAVKEIQNLIASDQHPNIVRWYGVEYDQDFVYLSLERCTCSLYELVSFHTSKNQITTSDQYHESPSPSNCNMQLLWNIGIDTEFKLWKDNGYPSAWLLKLMRDIVCGVSHLHELGIIHRDLKPQNVLVIKDRSVSAKISDMGISKLLDGDMSSLTKNATGFGSSGWQAPEQLRHERQTRSVDLFSLGCILFFCITGGKHPFGESLERDVNIVNNQKDLFLIDNIPEATDLISRLLDPNPELRPKAVEVLHHPMFWDSEMRLSFLRDVSDRVELEDRENASQLLEALESRGRVALGGKWDEKMDNTFINDIGRYRRYKFDSVRDLLRVIRNKLNHYRELSKDIQQILGSVPEGFDLYFSSRFPKLLIEVYGIILNHCSDEEIFHKYLASNRF